MKALIVIDIDENHLARESNELYERLKGRKCKLMRVPGKIDDEDGDLIISAGWNACIDEILEGMEK